MFVLDFKCAIDGKSVQYIVNAARGFEFVNVYSAAGLLILLIMLHKVACLCTHTMFFFFLNK